MAIRQILRLCRAISFLYIIQYRPCHCGAGNFFTLISIVRAAYIAEALCYGSSTWRVK